jgi:hypothetical protein
VLIYILIGAGAFIVLAGVILAIASNERAVGQERQLNARARSAEQQIHEIGERTRAAIIAEARRRQQGRP